MAQVTIDSIYALRLSAMMSVLLHKVPLGTAIDQLKVLVPNPDNSTKDLDSEHPVIRFMAFGVEVEMLHDFSIRHTNYANDVSQSIVNLITEYIQRETWMRDSLIDAASIFGKIVADDQVIAFHEAQGTSNVPVELMRWELITFIKNKFVYRVRSTREEAFDTIAQFFGEPLMLFLRHALNQPLVSKTITV